MWISDIDLPVWIESNRWLFGCQFGDLSSSPFNHTKKLLHFLNKTEAEGAQSTETIYWSFIEPPRCNLLLVVVCWMDERKQWTSIQITHERECLVTVRSFVPTYLLLRANYTHFTHTLAEDHHPSLLSWSDLLSLWLRSGNDFPGGSMDARCDGRRICRKNAN